MTYAVFGIREAYIKQYSTVKILQNSKPATVELH